MMLISSEWRGVPSFKLIPILESCPFVEALYDRHESTLVVFSKIKKDHLTMLPRLNDDGEPVTAKKPKRNGAPYQEQRTNIQVFQEYYISGIIETEAFIKKFAENSDTYDFKSLLMPPPAPVAQEAIKTAPALVDENGLPIK